MTDRKEGRSDRATGARARAREPRRRGVSHRAPASREADAHRRVEHGQGVVIRRRAEPGVRDRERGRGGLLRRLGGLSLGGLVIAGVGAVITSGVRRPVVAHATMTIGRRPGELHDFWRDLENLPRVIPHVRQVRSIDRLRSQWTVEGPGGAELSWSARIVEDTPTRIAWRSEPGAAVDHEGEVRFVPAPGDRGTEVHVSIAYRPPLRRIGAVVAALSGTEASQTLREGLRRLKMWMETGEIATTEGQSSGRLAEGREAGRAIERVGEAAKVLVTGGAQ